jgi:hypothetical protein
MNFELFFRSEKGRKGGDLDSPPGLVYQITKGTQTTAISWVLTAKNKSFC